jgi:hypothetical protein
MIEKTLLHQLHQQQQKYEAVRGRKKLSSHIWSPVNLTSRLGLQKMAE